MTTVQMRARQATELRMDLAETRRSTAFYDTCDGFPCSNWSMFVDDPHGRPQIFLMLFDKEAKKAAIMEVNRKFIKDMRKDVDRLERLAGLLGERNMPTAP